jgi:hypothetical protein
VNQFVDWHNISPYTTPLTMSQDNQKKRKADDTNNSESKENTDKASEILLALETSDHAFDQGFDDSALRILTRIAKLFVKHLRNEDALVDWTKLRKHNQEYLNYKKVYTEKVDANLDWEQDQDGEQAAEAKEREEEAAS